MTWVHVVVAAALAANAACAVGVVRYARQAESAYERAKQARQRAEHARNEWATLQADDESCMRLDDGTVLCRLRCRESVTLFSSGLPPWRELGWEPAATCLQEPNDRWCVRATRYTRAGLSEYAIADSSSSTATGTTVPSAGRRHAHSPAPDGCEST